jgi:hypothetical protein
MASWPMVNVHGARTGEVLVPYCQQPAEAAAQRDKGRIDRLDHTELGRNHRGSIDRGTA